MTFFHEIGHSMNANHDDAEEFKDRKGECTPSDDGGGSYLMFPTATEGLLPNNRVYSHCSLDTISYCSSLQHFLQFSSLSLLRKYTERLGRMKPKCLSTTKSVKHRCDGIYSPDEICDEHGMLSTCCTADCKLKPGALCSPVSSIDRSISNGWVSVVVGRFLLPLVVSIPSCQPSMSTGEWL